MSFNFNFNFPPTTETARLRADEPDPVEHPPIIIDNGSASIRFAVEEYDQVAGQNKFRSEGLYLQKIMIKGSGDHTCYTVPGGVRCKVVVTCRRNANPADTRDFTIVGANVVDGGSPTIDFSFVDFTEVPSGDPRYRKFSSAGFTIHSLKIFVVALGVETLVHTIGAGDIQAVACPFVPSNGACEITICDEHVRI